jgi:hypothetical protein
MSHQRPAHAGLFCCTHEIAFRIVLYDHPYALSDEARHIINVRASSRSTEAHPEQLSMPCAAATAGWRLDINQARVAQSIQHPVWQVFGLLFPKAYANRFESPP